MSDILQRIQTLQFSDKRQAENLLVSFIRQTFPLDVQTIELRPLAVSLNSFNGFMTLADGKRLFFKTHTEPDTVIGEYYHAATLAKAGYPVIQPLFSSTEVGKQILIYEVVKDPSVFDVAWAIEMNQSNQLAELTTAQEAADDQLLDIYIHSLQVQSAVQAAAAPIHQLFYHRLVGGRLARFYGETGHDVKIALPDGYLSTMREVRQMKWTINGQRYIENLDEIITRAIALLNPAVDGPSVVGHGDAHNGNVFFQHSSELPSLLYFDPAFAGRHHPLLDLTKPLFHNVFAMWMYFPQSKRDQTAISLRRSREQWEVDYDYGLPPVRHMFLRSKVERVFIPILAELKRQGQLRADWRAYLKAALFCCPFLTMNLTDSAKFPPEISLLGLAMTIEMGSESHQQRSIIDQILDEVSQLLS
jgi:hypothetical protein